MRLLSAKLALAVGALAPGPALARASASNVQGLYSLVQRLMPQHDGAFTFNLVSGDGDAFTVSDTPDQSGGITVDCTTVSACARGIHTYVTEFGGVDIFWTGSRLDQLSSPLPSVGTPVTGSAIVPYRYFLNTVTFDYTFAWADFDQWALELDWLALRGVNLPLAWVGYEYTLSQVFLQAGLSQSDLDDFFAGPAFLAWNRFGNIQGSWGGTLPQQWIEDQYALQQQLLPRMLELGMTPIMPSFPGFVPMAMAELYPDASIVRAPSWATFTTHTNVSFLEPTDPLFAQLQQSFISKQRASYNITTHIYTLDQFNEINPLTNDTTYLGGVANATFASLRAADPDAVWLMQGWLFYESAAFWTDPVIEAFLGAVPDDGMIILDLWSDVVPEWTRTDSYYGKTWVWCMVHDYGGNMGMEGNLPEISTGPIAALRSNGSTMQGIGGTMEGQEGNELVYDLLLDSAWSAEPLDVSSYIQSWVTRRYYAKPLPAVAQEAWEILGPTVYNDTNLYTEVAIKSIFELSPKIDGLVNITFATGQPTEIYYDTNTTIVPALQLLVQAAEENSALLAVPEFTYDVIYIARQLLSNRFIDKYEVLVSTYNASGATAEAVAAAGQSLIDILLTVDALLGTNENFLLSKWIADARSWAGDNETYANYLEYNARNQITLWGPTGELSDYASKQWSGLIRTYHIARWDAFIGYLQGTLANRATYNATEVADIMLDVGLNWDTQIWGQGEGENWDVTGDTWEIVRQILDTWA